MKDTILERFREYLANRRARASAGRPQQPEPLPGLISAGRSAPYDPYAQMRRARRQHVARLSWAGLHHETSWQRSAS